MGRHFVRSSRLPEPPAPGASRTPTAQARVKLRGAGGPRPTPPRSRDIPAEIHELAEMAGTDFDNLPDALSRPDLAAITAIRRSMREARV